MPKYTADEAREKAEQIRTTIEQMVCHFDAQDIRVTMSFGVKEIESSKTVEMNIEEVDAKLYEAKKTGRNKVIC